MSDATDDKSFGLVLTAINEAHKRIVYITCDRNIFSADCCVVWCMIFMLQVDARKVTKIGLESKQGKQDLNHKIRESKIRSTGYGITGHPNIRSNS